MRPSRAPTPLTVAEDSPATALDLLGNDSDVEGDPLTVTQLTGAAHGAVAPSGTYWTYAPDPDFHGTESLTYLVADGNGATDTGTVTITVTPVQDAPVASTTRSRRRRTPSTCRSTCGQRRRRRR